MEAEIFKTSCRMLIVKPTKKADGAYFQRYTHRVLQTIQMKLILFCVWAEQAILGSAKLL